MTGLESVLREVLLERNGTVDDALLQLILAMLEEEEHVMHQTYPRRIVQRLDALLTTHLEG